MHVSVQLWTVRRELKADLAGTIARLAAIGFTRVEPFDLAVMADDLAPALREHGIAAPSSHADLLSADAIANLQAAKRLGVTTIIHPHVPAERWRDRADIQATADRLNAVARLAASYDLRVGYHNHWWEPETQIDGRTALEYFAGLLDPQLVLEVDAYWAQVGGADPAALVGRLGDRVVALHLKDGPGRAPGTLVESDLPVVKGQLPAGSGVVDLPGVVRAAKSLELGVIEFDEYSGDIFDGLSQAFGFITANTGLGR